MDKNDGTRYEFYTKFDLPVLTTDRSRTSLFNTASAFNVTQGNCKLGKEAIPTSIHLKST